MYLNMKNIKRHPDFINLKHKIDKCIKLSKLEEHKEVVLRFKDKHKEDGNDLMIIYLRKYDELNPEYKWESPEETENHKDDFAKK